MPTAIELYKQLHAIPEPSLQEYETSDFIKGQLEAHGIAYQSVLETGILVHLPGKSDETIALRADMDALPLVEKNNFDYVSPQADHMHACGHDGHMSMLLKLLIDLKDHALDKSILAIFQPAEENIGGANLIVKSGALDVYPIAEVYGMHLWPDLPYGTVASKAGALMAMNSEFDVTIHGKKAHAGRAQQGCDAIVIASHCLTGYQQIVARQVDPVEPAVLHTGTIDGGEARNIVCDAVAMTGTIRTFSEATMTTIITAMQRQHRALEQQFGCTIDDDIRPMYPPVVNDDVLFRQLTAAGDLAIDILSAPVMPAEDFSYYQRRYPGVFFFLGLAESDDQPPLHSDQFRFNLDVLEKGVDFYKRLLRARGAFNNG